jgi:hypothetical protein
MWIKSAAWDGFWILSGLPLGFVLTSLWRFGPAMPVPLIVALFLANGHLLAPVFAAWGNDTFRERMRAQVGKYVALPSALLLGATGIGIGTSILLPHYRPNLMPAEQIIGFEHDWNLFAPLALVYLAWNAYHFGMQNFGVLRLYGRGNRHIDRAYTCGTTWAAMAAPLVPMFVNQSFLPFVWYAYVAVALVFGGAMVAHEIVNGSLPRVIFSATLALGIMASFWSGLWAFAIISINHWLVAIGLASAAHSRWDGRRFALAAAGLSLVGAILFSVLFLRLDLTLRLTAWAVGFRIGLGFVHFVYDRWIYKSSAPFVRGAIGKALLP